MYQVYRILLVFIMRQAIYVYRKTQARSRKHFCRGKKL